eukprot:PhM_4_TR14292/c0_g1_i1/m.29883
MTASHKSATRSSSSADEIDRATASPTTPTTTTTLLPQKINIRIPVSETRTLRLRSDFECGSIGFTSYEFVAESQLHVLSLFLVPDVTPPMEETVDNEDEADGATSCVPAAASDSNTIFIADGGAESLRAPLGSPAAVSGSDADAPDATPTCPKDRAEVVSRMWFYFRVEGLLDGEGVEVVLSGIASKSRLFPQGHRPVVRTGHDLRWALLGSSVKVNLAPAGDAGPTYGGTVRYTLVPATQVPSCRAGTPSWVENAFTFPYTLNDVRVAMASWRKRCTELGLTYTERVLAKALSGIDLPYFSVSMPSTHTEPKAAESKEKRALLFSARVHPGEVPASWMLHGLVDRVLMNPARYLSEHDLHVVPILNPDGVYFGYTRGDTNGRNLNRFYDVASADAHPTIHAMRDLFCTLDADTASGGGGVQMYMDLHAHATRRGCFVYGNRLDDPEDAAFTLSFVNTMAARCDAFDRAGCNFSERNMRTKGKNDTRGKQGSSRVALYALTGNPRCLTFEVNYNTSAPKVSRERHRYTPATFLGIGSSIVDSVIDAVGGGDEAAFTSIASTWSSGNTESSSSVNVKGTSKKLSSSRLLPNPDFFKSFEKGKKVSGAGAGAGGVLVPLGAGASSSRTSSASSVSGLASSTSSSRRPSLGKQPPRGGRRGASSTSSGGGNSSVPPNNNNNNNNSINKNGTARTRSRSQPRSDRGGSENRPLARKPSVGSGGIGMGMGGRRLSSSRIGMGE